MEYVVTLSNEPEIYTLTSINNLDRPKPNQIRFHLKTLSAAQKAQVARTATNRAIAELGLGKVNRSDPEYEGVYLNYYQEESFSAQITKIENLMVRDKEGEPWEITDPGVLWNSEDNTLALIATEVITYITKRSVLPEKN